MEENKKTMGEVIDIVTEENEVEEAKESKLKAFGSKVVNFTKTNGKKIAKVVVIAAVGFVGYTIGAMSHSGDAEDFEEVEDMTFTPEEIEESEETEE